MSCFVAVYPMSGGSNKYAKDLIGGVAMPRGDRTGPLGLGPITGRGAGFCAEFIVPEYLNLAGQNLSFGRRRRYRRLLWAAGLIPGCTYLAYRWTNRNR